jgi:hypothetical protein
VTAVHLTASWIRSRGRKVTAFALFALVLLSALALASSSKAAVESPPPPQVWSDKADYAPGEAVSLSGANWAPGEAVHIRVNDDAGQTWSRDVDVTAANDGSISDHFQLPTSFVATYSVTASGVSGTATWSFTDGNVKFDVVPTGKTAQFVETLYSASGNCTGAVKSGFPKTLSASSGDNVGVGNNESIRIDAAAVADQGGAFQAWSSTDSPASPFTVITGTGGKSICISGFQSGTRNYRAMYGAANTAPVANAQAVTTNEDTAKTITLSGSDADGNNLTFAIGSSPTHGTLGSTGTVTCTGASPRSCSADVTYTPALNYNGSDSFTFKVNDGTVDSSAATVSITVTAVNDAPTCSNGSATTDEDSAVAAPLSCADVDGDSLTYAIVAGPAHGSLSGSGASRTYTPAANYNGSDSFTFKASDGAADSDTATFSLTVTPANDDPTVARDDGFVTVDEGETAANTGTFGDVDGDTVTLTASVGTIVKDESAGTWSWSFDTSDGPDDSQTVTITANDGQGGSSSTTFSLTVNNVAPTVSFSAGNDTSVNEGTTHTYAFTVTDPGVDTFTVDTYGCGGSGVYVTGSLTTSASGGSFQCTFPDGPASSSVNVKVKDSDGASDSDSEAVQVVAIANVAPTVDLSGPASASEGDTKTYTYTVSDPGDDLNPAITESCGANGNYTNTAAADSFDCTFPDGPASSTVKVTADDGDPSNNIGSDEIDVTVNNVDPVVTAAADQSSDEGETHSFSLGSFTDPGDDGPWSVDVDWGDGSAHTTFSEASAGALTAKSHKYADGPNDHTVTVKVSEAGTAPTPSGQATFSVHVNNVAPTIAWTSAPNPVNENKSGSVTYTFSISDPGDDVSAYLSGYPKCGANGTLQGSPTIGASSGSFQCRFSDGPAFSLVEAKVNDGTDDSNGLSENVEVKNVAPTVNLSGPNTADEGTTKEYTFTLADPGDDSFTFVSGPPTDYPTCGAYGQLLGSPTVAGGSFQCYFPDGPKTTSVAIKVQDDDGGVSAPDVEQVDIISVTIANVPPTVTAPANQNADEGQSKSFTLGSFDDPGADADWKVDVSWGDTSLEPQFTVGSSGVIPAHSHAYADNGTYTVTVTVTDKDGASDSNTFQVAVANVAPTAEFTNNGPVDEGSSFLLTMSNGDDVSSTDKAAKFEFAFDCGDGSGYGAYSSPAALSASANCSTSDNGTRSVKARIKDKDGGVTEYTASVTVTNVAPTAEFTNNGPVDEGSSFTLTMSNGDDVSSADKAAKFEFSFDCGDGSGYGAYSSPAALSASANCSTSDNGTRSVRAKIRDKDGGVREYTGSVTVKNVAPTVSFVSGATSANEGDTKSYSYSWTDPSSADTFPNHSVDCGPKGTALNEIYTAVSKTGSFDCRFGDDSGGGTFAVKATVKDDDGGEGSDTKQVDVDNVNPTASNPAFAFDPVLGTATASFNFADLGYLDTHAASFFTWSAGVAGLKTVTEENAFPDATGTASEKRTFVPGCYNLTVTGTAKDDDGGMSAPLSIFSGSTTGVYANGFRPPIIDNERNIAKYGNVVPVKVALTNPCTGATVTNVSLFVQLLKGVNGEYIQDTNTVTESVSAADSGQQMRTADGMYIFNLSTKSLVANSDYAVQIRLGSVNGPTILQAVLQPKK